MKMQTDHANDYAWKFLIRETSLSKVMQGKKADPSEPSTGVMDKPICIEQSTIVVDGLTWNPID